MTDFARYADYPLRARKRAATRVALVNALLPKLAEMPLDEVSVAELAREANISQATFFNYFPTKGDLLTHFVQLWSLKVAAVADDLYQREQNPLKALEALYQQTAIEVSEHPRIMTEIIAHQAHHGASLDAPSVEHVERLLYLEDDPRAASLSDRGLGVLLPKWIGEAVARGFLPHATPVMDLVLNVSSLFFGIPLLLSTTAPQMIGPMYASQLQLVWAGARARYSDPSDGT